MPRSKKSTLAAVTLLFSLLLSCRGWTTAPALLEVVAEPAAESLPALPTPESLPAGSERLPAQDSSQGEEELSMLEPAQMQGEINGVVVRMGDPAGCLSAEAQSELAAGMDMLAYADSLIALDWTLGQRVLPGAWNATTQRYEYDTNRAISLDVSTVKNEYLLQSMLNALHVAGFVAWLRDGARPDQDAHILAVPLVAPEILDETWKPYVDSYWQGPQSTPEGDPYVRPALKLPPCAWMVERGLAPQVDAGWWAENRTGWPDYAAAGEAYLAATTQEANHIARQIDYLGAQLEGADTVCGPLSWSILRDAGAFPPGMGAWLGGSRTFWLADPPVNGRPWSLFPPGTYTVHHFGQPISEFDFGAWPLYPGDFFYTYSAKDGFDHMFVVTEVDAQGNVYTVTNLVHQGDEKQVTIERALLLNLYQPGPGLVYNEWRDRSNGRTGHDGFDVFRWDWMEKDILGQDVLYTLQPGDTLGLVSLRWKTPADRIAQYNQISGDASLFVGQKLRIPPNKER